MGMREMEGSGESRGNVQRFIIENQKMALHENYVYGLLYFLYFFYLVEVGEWLKMKKKIYIMLKFRLILLIEVVNSLVSFK